MKTIRCIIESSDYLTKGRIYAVETKLIVGYDIVDDTGDCRRFNGICFEDATKDNQKTKDKKHPLLNENSKHYSMADGKEAIERMEQMYSVEDLQAWAKISAMKYRLRIGKKDDPSKELVKIKTFEDYFEYLEEIKCQK